MIHFPRPVLLQNVSIVPRCGCTDDRDQRQQDMKLHCLDCIPACHFVLSRHVPFLENLTATHGSSCFLQIFEYDCRPLFIQSEHELCLKRDNPVLVYLCDGSAISGKSIGQLSCVTG